MYHFDSDEGISISTVFEMTIVEKIEGHAPEMDCRDLLLG
jgi:hypothetical protein